MALAQDVSALWLFLQCCCPFHFSHNILVIIKLARQTLMVFHLLLVHSSHHLLSDYSGSPLPIPSLSCEQDTHPRLSGWMTSVWDAV